MVCLFPLGGSTVEAKGALALDASIQVPLVLAHLDNVFPDSLSSRASAPGVCGVHVGREGVLCAQSSPAVAQVHRSDPVVRRVTPSLLCRMGTLLPF